MRTRRSPRNQNILFRELFAPADKPKPITLEQEAERLRRWIANPAQRRHKKLNERSLLGVLRRIALRDAKAREASS